LGLGIQTLPEKGGKDFEFKRHSLFKRKSCGKGKWEETGLSAAVGLEKRKGEPRVTISLYGGEKEGKG